MQLVVMVMVFVDFSFHIFQDYNGCFFSLNTTSPALTAAAVTEIKNKLLAKYQLPFSFVLTSFDLRYY